MGFYGEWFKAIESYGWYWLSRVRQGRSLKIADSDSWISIKDFIPLVKEKTTHYSKILLTKEHEHSCRLVTTKRTPKGRVRKDSHGSSQGVIGCRRYNSAAKEPWILATNLPESDFKSVQIVNL